MHPQGPRRRRGRAQGRRGGRARTLRRLPSRPPSPGTSRRRNGRTRPRGAASPVDGSRGSPAPRRPVRGCLLALRLPPPRVWTPRRGMREPVRQILRGGACIYRIGLATSLGRSCGERRPPRRRGGMKMSDPVRRVGGAALPPRGTTDRGTPPIGSHGHRFLSPDGGYTHRRRSGPRRGDLGRSFPTRWSRIELGCLKLRRRCLSRRKKFLIPRKRLVGLW